LRHALRKPVIATMTGPHREFVRCFAGGVMLCTCY
jgi:hypothetical protein